MLSCSYSKPQAGGLFDIFKNVADVVDRVANDGARSLDGGGVKGFLDNIRNNIRNNPLLQRRILGNRLNPCDGEAPKSCNCTNGQEFPFSINYYSIPCTGVRAELDICTCPRGQTFKPKNLAQKAATEFGIPTCGEGQTPESCTCRDGTTVSVNRTAIAGGARPCGGRLPRSCTCQDGKEITASQVISRVIPAIQDILG